MLRCLEGAWMLFQACGKKQVMCLRWLCERVAACLESQIQTRGLAYDNVWEVQAMTA
jgi:hypothetical protein